MARLNKKDVEYNKAAISEIKIAMKEEKNLRTYKRYSVVLKHFQGFTNRSISAMEGLDVHSVATYIKTYKEHGIGALTAKKSTGAPRKLSKEQEDIIVDLITNNTPDEVGFDSRKNWTIELVRQWIISNFNIIIKHSSMAVILHRLNLSYTRPTYVLKKADKEKQEIFKSNFEALKKTP